MTTQTDAPGVKVWTDAEIDALRPKTGGSFQWDAATGSFTPVSAEIRPPEPVAPSAEASFAVDVSSETTVKASKGAK